MELQNNKIQGDLVVESNLNFHGMVTGNAIVSDGAIFNLYGMVCGNLILESNSKAIIRGTVSGNLIINGGQVELLGRVIGAVLDNTSN